MLKKRSIKVIHERLQKAYKIRVRRHKDHMIWFDSCPKEFWGYIKIDTEKVKVIFSLLKNAYRQDFLRPGSEDYMYQKIRIAHDKDLPLMISEDLNKREKKLFEKRLRGDVCQTAYRQDLVDKYEQFNIISKHIWVVIDNYEKFLSRYVYKLYSEHKFSLNRHQLIIYRIQDHTYYLNSEFKVLTDIYEINEKN